MTNTFRSGLCRGRGVQDDPCGEQKWYGPSRALNNVDFPIPLIKFSCVVTGMELSDYNDRAKHYGQQHKKNFLIVPCAMNISTVMKKGIGII